MNTYETERKELARQLVTYKKAYRRDSPQTEMTRYLAKEIHALEQLLRGN